MAEPPLCVYCRRRPVEPAWRPFCSERCRTIDLGRWLTGGYRVPDKAEEPVDLVRRDVPEDDRTTE